VSQEQLGAEGTGCDESCGVMCHNRGETGLIHTGFLEQMDRCIEMCYKSWQQCDIWSSCSDELQDYCLLCMSWQCNLVTKGEACLI
jgi:hypothetical protein